MLNKSFIFIIVSCLLLVGLLSACVAGTASSETRVEEPAAMPPMDMAFEGGESVYVESDVAQVANTVAGIDQSGERMVIQNSNLTLVVPEPEKSIERIRSLADELGGFVVSANLYQQATSSGEMAPYGSITIRVPSERVNDALSRIRSESAEPPVNENSNSQDVTGDYTDLQSRLRNEQAAERQLTSIMEEARRTEDVLAVYSQLVQVRERIEVLQGQIQYLEQSTALSAIAVELLPDESVQPIEIGGWKLGGVAKDAIEALLNGLRSFATAVIWFGIAILPQLLLWVIVLGLPIVLVIWIIRRIRRRGKAAKNTAEPRSDIKE